MKSESSRRGFLRQAGALSALSLSASLTPGQALAGSSFTRSGSASVQSGADDTAYWDRVRDQFHLPEGVVQLENGNWGVMAKPVLEAYQNHTFRVNRDSSYYSRRGMWKDVGKIRHEVAALLGVDAQEIVFTRGATEALQNLILSYRSLKPGDAVLYADTDYDAMQSVMASLRDRRGATLRTIALPERATQETLLETYRGALNANSDIKLILLTHLSHRHGMVLPVREIVAMARERGVDCIIDAAHSWGQLDFSFSDLDADFAGLNLHKWMGAPVGVGVMYIRKERLETIAPFPGETPGSDPILSRVHTGTFNYAALLTVPEALAFHHQLGPRAKAERLAWLRDYWVKRVKKRPGLQVLTLDGVEDHAGISAFRLRDQTSAEANKSIAQALLDRHGVFTVHRTGLAGGSCVRVTPALFTSTADLDRLLAGLDDLLSK